MTKAKETIPSPSHPIRSVARFGIKINKFIDKTNSITSHVNRGKNLSCSM